MEERKDWIFAVACLTFEAVGPLLKNIGKSQVALLKFHFVIIDSPFHPCQPC